MPYSLILKKRQNLKLSSAANYRWRFMGSCIISGFGMCVCWLGSFVTIGWIFHTNPGVPLVFLTVGSSAGQLLLPYLYELFISQFGWRGAFLIMGALALNCLPVGVLIHTSRKFYPTGTGSEGDKQKITGIFDVSLFKDPVIMLFVFNCLVIILTCKISSQLVLILCHLILFV